MGDNGRVPQPLRTLCGGWAPTVPRSPLLCLPQPRPRNASEASDHSNTIAIIALRFSYFFSFFFFSA